MKHIHDGEKDLCSLLAKDHIDHGRIEKELNSISEDQQADVTINVENEVNSILENDDTDLTLKEDDAADDAMTVPEISVEETKDKAALYHFSEHNYFSKKKKAVQHKCDDCGYITIRKNTLINHQAETCQVRRQKGLLAVKNTYCKYCSKRMRHNALRSHLRHFIKMLKANRKPKGKHSLISEEELTNYLNEIKLKR